MKLILRIFIAATISTLSFIAIDYVYAMNILKDFRGFVAYEEVFSSVIFISTMVIGTVLGFLVSHTVASGTIRKVAVGQLLAALALSPILIALVYEKLVNVDDLALVFVVCAQNAYFWDRISYSLMVERS